jgi:hypothetical protein
MDGETFPHGTMCSKDGLVCLAYVFGIYEKYACILFIYFLFFLSFPFPFSVGLIMYRLAYGALPWELDKEFKKDPLAY